MTPLFDDLKTLEFQSPTFGRIDFETVFAKLIDYIEEDPSQKYNLIIGSDSFRSGETIFVSAIVIHRVGHGGRYFYKKRRGRKVITLRHRIIYETTMSIELASVVEQKLSSNGYGDLPVEIHLDVGTKGDTKDIIKEVVGMVTGCGYRAVTKPDGYGASKVADRHSR
jgi:predicted RNase H-related nuclease YkuK (DUF458 family)